MIEIMIMDGLDRHQGRDCSCEGCAIVFFRERIIDLAELVIKAGANERLVITNTKDMDSLFSLMRCYKVLYPKEDWCGEKFCSLVKGHKSGCIGSSEEMLEAARAFFAQNTETPQSDDQG